MARVDRGVARRQSAERRGRRSEMLALFLLSVKGYRILGRRIRTHAGEIDLVARAPSGVICFIEVKARGTRDLAAEALGARQQARIARAAELYLAARPGLDLRGVRFDVVILAPRTWPQHIRDAWRPNSG